MTRIERDLLALPFLPATRITATHRGGGYPKRPPADRSSPTPPPARLAIDIGAHTTTAVVEIDGQRTPLVFDGQPALPTMMVAGPDGTRDAKTALTPSAHTDAPALAVYRDLLNRIAEHAQVPIAQLILTVPPDWSTGRRDLVRQCATAAGLPDPVLVSEAAAAAHATIAGLPTGEQVLVCDLGTVGRFTLLRRTDRGWHQLSTHDDVRCGGRGLDTAMAEQLDPDHAGDRTLLARCAAARADLRGQDADGVTAILLPGRTDPCLYRADDLSQVVDEACAATVAAASETLLDAGVPGATRLAAIVVRGGAAASIQPADELRPLTTSVRHNDDPHALCRAALAMTHRPDPVRTPPGVKADRRWLRPSRLAAIVLPAILGAYLASQEIDETFTYTDRLQSYRDSSDYLAIAVLFDRPAFAHAAWLLMMAAIAAGTLLVTALQRDDLDRQTPGRHRTSGGRMLVFAVVVGIAAVVMQGELAQAVISGNPDILPGFVGIALKAVAVPAAVAALAGLLVPLSPRLSATAWADRLHFPVAAAVTAAAGSIAANLYFDGPRNLQDLFFAWGDRVGALLMAVAIALTLFRSAVARIALGTVVGLGAFIASSAAAVAADVQQQITVAYLIAVGFWWLRQGARLILDAVAHLQPAAPPAPAAVQEPTQPS